MRSLGNSLTSSRIPFGVMHRKWNSTSRESNTQPRRKRTTKKLTSRQRRRQARYSERVTTPRRSYEEHRGEGEIIQLRYDSLPFSLDGVEIKRSERWCYGPQIQSEYRIPFINRWGFISGSTFATVRCTPQQYIATVISTLVKRFRNIAIRHIGHRGVIKIKALLVKAAYYYSVSKNDWYRRRIVELLKGENRRAIFGLTMNYLSKMDDYTRFVYSQVNFQTNWLFSRALVPRDKSKFFSLSPTFQKSGLKETRLQWKAFRLISVRISSLSPPRFGCD
ncbi:hypothetical protein [Aspergillus creber narnavirus 1]|nr:hypothetical protein [Aspergillus creber narnavirus 1]